jgi:hypothetical protein
MGMKEQSPVHRNSLLNGEEHHLYAFFDMQLQETFKYGISSDPIQTDGLSRRISRQLEIFNLAAGWNRYTASIILTGIQGRRAAEALEDQYIAQFEAEFGRLPRGNKRKNRAG